MKENKKMIAAVSAVMHYLKEEEDVICGLASAKARAAAAAARAAAPGPAISPWAMSGRAEIMQNRSMMQMKAFHRN